MDTAGKTTIGIVLALTAACATARPAFEWQAPSGGRLRGDWTVVLASRYGCDTVQVPVTLRGPGERNAVPATESVEPSRLAPVTTGCGVWYDPVPASVRAYVTGSRVKEDWTYTAPRPLANTRTLDAPLRCVLGLEGDSARALRPISYTCY